MEIRVGLFTVMVIAALVSVPWYVRKVFLV
jgi:hypothetical protein